MFLLDQRGATVIEYILLLVLVAFLVAATAQHILGEDGTVFETVRGHLANMVNRIQ